MKTITVQIGNSDDKLTQKRWSEFVAEVRDCIVSRDGIHVHFFGTSDGHKPWQNACFVLQSNSEISTQTLRRDLEITRKKFDQDSIAFTVGDTAFI